MGKAILLYFTFFLSMVFMFTPEGPRWTPFLFSSQSVSAEAYSYYLWEHAVKIILFYMIKSEAVSYRRFFSFMFWFQVADTFDYIMTYNEVWMKVGKLPVSMNVFGCVLGGSMLIKEYLSEKNL